MNRLIIIGASGHGKVVADIAKLKGYKDIVFLDNDLSKRSCLSYPVLGPDQLADELDGEIFLAVGNAQIRQKLMNRNVNRIFPTLIHPNAVIADDVIIEEGSVVMAGAVINSGTVIGRGCIINTCSSVDHDCIIKDYVHVSVAAHLCGTVSIGENTWIGAGAIVSNNISICGNCMIGAGTVVVKDITDSGTYIGVPAALLHSVKGEKQCE